MAVQKVATQVIEDAAVTDAKLNTTGTMPAWNGSALTNLPGEKRNFIIDGDFTQWPEGATAFSPTSTNYGAALWEELWSNDGTYTVERSTDTPTFASANYEAEYSILYKCTGTDASIGAAQFVRNRYVITGTDYQALHQKTVTLSFWAKTAAANSGHRYYINLSNNGLDRCYVSSFSPTSTWTKYSFTIDLDTTGTWTFTEATRGLGISICLAAGSDYDDATENTWTAGNEMWTNGTAISNFLDSTSNEFYMTMVKLEFGTATDFSGEPIATVQDQVAYYVERFDLGATTTPIMMGQIYSTTAARCLLRFRTKRATPSVVTDGGTIGNFLMLHSASHALTNLTFVNHLLDSSLATATVASGLTSGQACQICGASDNWILVDSRH